MPPSPPASSQGTSGPAALHLTVNGKDYTVENPDPRTTLSEFLRGTLRLSGTKVMCHEGGCGCCVVTVQYADPLQPDKVLTESINSCLAPLCSLDGHHVITVEGVGVVRGARGLHPVQQRLVEHHGIQCGYCSPGFVMQMYSLLASNPTPSQQEVEDVFDGNICRCTGYRPILDAMKSFAKDGKSPLSPSCLDIEDLKFCPKNGRPCRGNHSCSSGEATAAAAAAGPAHLFAATDVKWFRPVSLTELLVAVERLSEQSVKLVRGDTSKGVYKTDGPFQAYVDVKGVAELFAVSLEATGLRVGSSVSLNKLIGSLREHADQSESFAAAADHLSKVANQSVRNAGGWAGNLMMKHAHRDFVSDVFVVLEAAGAKIRISDVSGEVYLDLVQFLSKDMKGKVIVSMEIPKLTPGEVFKSFKVMMRAQNAHAYVSAGFRAKIDAGDGGERVVTAASLVYGGVAPGFVHAERAERFLLGKDVTSAATLQGVLLELADELTPNSDPVAASPEYRKSLALSLFYKFYLSIAGDDAVSPRNRSACHGLGRAVSSGEQTYDTQPADYPLTQPIAKLESSLQASGEAEFVNDIPAMAGELYAVFAQSSVPSAKLVSIDSAAALAIPEAVRVITAADIPPGGRNSTMPSQFLQEEIFCSSQVLYTGQSIALCVAESRGAAEAMAKAVSATYTEQRAPVLTVDDAIAAGSLWPSPADDLVVGDAEAALAKSARVIEGDIRAGDQYHFYMETQVCRCVPTDVGLEVQASHQWLDLAQQGIAEAVGLRAKDVTVTAKRLGGGYGGKALGANAVACATAVAAFLLNRPVRCSLSLHNDMEMLGKRHRYIVKYKVGFTEEGLLNGVLITYYCDNGCANNDNEVGQCFCFSDNVYKCANWHLIPVALKTNTPSHQWCRSPGSITNIFVMETIMEQIGQELGKDPVEVRRLNLYSKGDVTPLGYLLPYCSIHQLYADLLTTAAVRERQADIAKFNADNRWKKRGLAVVPIKYNLSWNWCHFLCTVAIYAQDGTITITHGGIEMGQGINTKVAQVCAFELGVPVDIVSVKPTTTLCSPNAQATGGSVSSEINCMGIQKCCEMLKDRMKDVKASLPPDTPWKDLVSACFKKTVNLTAQYWVWPDATSTEPRYNSYGVTATEAELDVLTGEHVLRRVDILFDCGQSMNPAIDVGQVEGAFTMGLGYWLTERLVYHPTSGQLLTNGTWEYKPPSSKDIPVDFRVHLLKDAPNPAGVLRSKASGEPPQCMSCSALLAVKHAALAARAEIARNDYFPLHGPATVDEVQQCCLVDPKQFTL
ncbi:LOW QUALITY PROTEIN: xanthine dehydrogenase-like [Lethenteron reissneri]|uniref:LOW QUALITY PROTEIN: xanthine dehydrogenase-like n=1 Tax=Lethenteron reissneri TaxID=7753 RepID=UPI002AB6FFAC|nr:LOW QUALITY PROTEIN: xanthine dehydrogenase-like [Lethenteron reissneri]